MQKKRRKIVLTNGVVVSVSAKRVDVDGLLVELLVGHHGLVLSGEGALAASVVREAGVRRRGLHLVNQVSAGCTLRTLFLTHTTPTLIHAGFVTRGLRELGPQMEETSTCEFNVNELIFL